MMMLAVIDNQLIITCLFKDHGLIEEQGHRPRSFHVTQSQANIPKAAHTTNGYFPKTPISMATSVLD